MTDDPVQPVRLKPIEELFTASATAFWATTYNVDLRLFNEFLFPRLGDPPLNTVILADERRLGTTLDRIAVDQVDSLANVNRRWLLRSVRPSGRAFHPKSYLTVSRGAATLLVGSGNLSTDGLDDGREVFTVYRSGTTIGDAAIASWRTWMRRLVEMVDDAMLGARFHDLDQRMPAQPPVAPVVDAPLLHNLDVPIAIQLIERVRSQAETVDELLLTAPFYDPVAGAVAHLLGELAPRRVHLFVTESTSVDGERLSAVLASSGAEARIYSFSPDAFVHAKLVGVIAKGAGWLFSGSANLSHAAMTNAVGDGGNVELAALTRLSPDAVRAVFTPPKMTAVEGDLSTLAILGFRSDEEPAAPLVRLLSAGLLTHRRLEIRCEQPAAAEWFVTDMTNRTALDVDLKGRAVTSEPLEGRLVHLVDENWTVLSNRVVVDDPQALGAALSASTSRSPSDTPPELASGDLGSPLAQALVWLHRNMVMDVSERATPIASGGVGDTEGDEQADDDFWERLAREQLARDPRALTYGRMWRPGTAGAEPLIELLEILRRRTPLESSGRTPGGGTPPPPPGDDAPKRRWKPATRIRVRARNVLIRWAEAQSDPRIVWVDPLAPVGNFVMIVGLLCDFRVQAAQTPQDIELTEDDLDGIWRRWLQSFVGTGHGDGYLDRLAPEELDASLQRLGDQASVAEKAAALCWLALRPMRDLRDHIIMWKPVLSAAVDRGVVVPTTATAHAVSEATGHDISVNAVDQHLRKVMDFIDDDLWCEKTAQDLELVGLRLKAPPGAPHIGVRLELRDVPGPLLDARIPRLVVAARAYRGCDGVAIYAVDPDWRLVFATDKTILYQPPTSSSLVDSTSVLTDGVLDRLAATGGVLASLFASVRVA